MGAIGGAYRVRHLRVEHDDAKCLSPALGRAREALLLPLPQANRDGAEACSHRKRHRADEVEPRVWNLVAGLLKDPERLKSGLEEMIEQERAGLRGDPNQEAKSWLERLAEVYEERRGYLRLAAKGA